MLSRTSKFIARRFCCHKQNESYKNIIVKTHKNSTRIIQLNRPKALNALC